MPRYQYKRLLVTAYEPREFSDLRAAVEHLKTLPDAKYVDLQADTVPLKIGTFRLIAPTFLKLKDVVGKTPDQVWEQLDLQVDRQVDYFAGRDRGYNPN